MNELGNYYKDIKKYEEMKKYYLMAINEDDVDAMNSLADYYKDIKDYEEMKKYYLMAIDNI